MPPFADSNRVSLRYIAETVWGTTPASGSSRELRIRSSSLSATKETVVSDELRADRMVGSVVEVAAMSGGDIEFEYSGGSHDDFLQAVLAGAWTRPMTFDDFTGVTVAWTANNTLVISGFDATPYFTVGRRVKTEGFLNPGNNNYWQISTISFASSNTTIVMTASTAVAEVGNAFSKIMDANDVIVLRDTTIRVSAGNIIDVASGTPFASARAAGQLVSGQKIFMEGFGYGSGTATFAAAATANQTVIVNDGVNSITFTFQSTGDGAAQVAFGAAQSDSATNLALAINRARVFGVNGVKLSVTATASAGVVTVRNLNTSGGSLTGTAGTIVSFSGGNAALRGVYTITAVTDSAITVAETIPTQAAGAAVTIKGSMLRNPGVVSAITPQSFTVETAFNDVGRFITQNGMRPGSFSINAQAGQIVTGTISLMGRQTLPRNAALIGTAPFAQLIATSTEVMNATSNVGSLVKNGVTLATALQSIELQIDGGLRNQNSVGSKFPRGVGLGRLNVTGTIQAYFETLELYNHFINHETISLGFNFQDVEGNYYFWTIPALKVNSDPVAPGGIDQDVMEQIEFVAFRDPNTACMLQVDRFSSVLPI
jgi:hypothetical protein